MAYRSNHIRPACMHTRAYDLRFFEFGHIPRCLSVSFKKWCWSTTLRNFLHTRALRPFLCSTCVRAHYMLACKLCLCTRGADEASVSHETSHSIGAFQISSTHPGIPRMCACVLCVCVCVCPGGAGCHAAAPTNLPRSRDQVLRRGLRLQGFLLSSILSNLLSLPCVVIIM